MCLGVPMRVVEVREVGGYRVALAEYGGMRREVDASVLDDIRPGDWVIVHAGIAISKMEPEEAEELLKIYEELEEALRT